MRRLCLYKIMESADYDIKQSRSLNALGDKYIDFKINGRLFPTWVLANFRNYKLPEIVRSDDEDPCFVKTKIELLV